MTPRVLRPRLVAAAAAVACATLAACASRGATASTAVPAWHIELQREFARQPDSLPDRWRGLVGEYGPDTATRWFALERDGRMHILDHFGNYVPLAERSDSVFDAPRSPVPVSGQVRFHRDTGGVRRAQSVQVADIVMLRRQVEPPPGTTQLVITPVRPVEELRREALAARPPAEAGEFRQPSLVDIRKLDSTIKLDIRYATTNNFLGTRIYEQPRALLQSPAADALVRANRALRSLGYGLLVFDAYRPWYVTKIFWDATPEHLRWLVADPSQGSKHNRGAAVDVTLYDLETGRPVEMPSTYDETTARARADYPGGSSLQRYHRALLIRALSHEGFEVYPAEWWHFDFKDWKSYPILNWPFDRM